LARSNQDRKWFADGNEIYGFPSAAKVHLSDYPKCCAPSQS
jgi:hypothetical protein